MKATVSWTGDGEELNPAVMVVALHLAPAALAACGPISAQLDLRRRGVARERGL